MHWYKRDIALWNYQTSHLSLEEESVYSRLLDFAILEEKNIPVDFAILARKLRLNCDKVVVENILNEFFTKTQDGWEHPMVASLKAAYENRVKANKDNGSKGGRPKKKGKPNHNPIETELKPNGFENKPNHNPTETENNPNKELGIRNKELGVMNYELGTMSDEGGIRRDENPHTQTSGLVPLDFKPSEAIMLAVGMGSIAGVKPSDIPPLVEKFIAYHRGAGTVKADWDYVFRYWLGNEAKFKKHKGATASAMDRDRELKSKLIQKDDVGGEMVWKAKK